MSNAALKLAPTTVEKDAAPAPAAKLKRPAFRRIIMSGVVLAALLAAADYGYNWFQLGRFQVSTDDAYVKSDMSQLGAKIAGYVIEIPIAENSAVKAGDVILKLDDGDYILAVAAAQAHISTQQANIATFTKQIDAQKSQVDAAKAQLVSAQAIEINAVKTQNRASQLVKNSAGTMQELDAATSARTTAEAAVNVAQANIVAAKAQVEILNAQSAAAQSAVGQLQIELQQAQRNLDATHIKAPFDGVVANRAVQLGQFVSPGTNLMALVPTQNSFIVANFKETQINNMHPGQKALISVDAFGGQEFAGWVNSVAPASGSEFSLLPPENATGNFTKITQRLPVKISLPPDLAAKLRPGLSVTVTVDLRDTGTDPQ
jgi:membrane fusion protein, multidrug efflux system